MQTVTYKFNNISSGAKSSIEIRVFKNGFPTDDKGKPKTERYAAAIKKEARNAGISISDTDADILTSWLVCDNAPTSFYKPVLIAKGKFEIQAKRQNRKIFTFHFSFTAPNDESDDSIEFCAYSRQEAVKLFKDWCLKDEKMRAVPSYEYEVVYNKDDEECETDYGMPGESIPRKEILL